MPFPPFPKCPAGRVVVVGDVMTDVIVRPQGTLVPAADRLAAIETHPGGSGANQAAWLAHLGVPAALAGRVGAADASAHEASLRRHGAVPMLARDARGPSGSIVSVIAPDGERSFYTDRGANDRLCRADLPDSLLEGTALLHVSGYALTAPGPRAAVLDLMAAARRRGVPVSFDPGSVSFLEDIGGAGVLDWLADVDILVPNEGEAALLAGTPDGEEQLRRIEVRIPLVVRKEGARGATAAAQGERVRCDAAPAAVVDTTGAGDAFLAGFLAAGVSGADIPACLAAGSRAAALAVIRVGGRPPTS